MVPCSAQESPQVHYPQFLAMRKSRLRYLANGSLLCTRVASGTLPLVPHHAQEPPQVYLANGSLLCARVASGTLPMVPCSVQESPQDTTHCSLPCARVASGTLPMVPCHAQESPKVNCQRFLAMRKSRLRYTTHGSLSCTKNWSMVVLPIFRKL